MIPFQSACFDAISELAAGILDERDNVIGRGTRHRVLKVEKAAGGDALAPGKSHEIINVVIAQHQCFRYLPRDRQNLAPEPQELFTQIGRAGLACDLGQVPVHQQDRFVQEPGIVIRRQPAGHHGFFGKAVQLHQNINRQVVERRLVATGAKHPGKGVVAEILDHQEALINIGGNHVGRAEAEITEMPTNPKPGANILNVRRRVHEHPRPGPAGEAGITAERRIP